MTLLAIDTSANNCAVAVMDRENSTILAEITENIGRGHAELLMSQIETCLEAAKSSYQTLTLIAVTIGPGSFTGVRVGLATARGLALGLSLPVIGVSTLDAAEAYAEELGADQPVAVMLDARRGQVFCKLPGEAPSVVAYDDSPLELETFNGVICGSGAREWLAISKRELPLIHEENTSPIGTIARLALSYPIPETPPEPLYLRSPDAKKQTGFALPRVGE